jgi:hypothetical protein
VLACCGRDGLRAGCSLRYDERLVVEDAKQGVDCVGLTWAAWLNVASEGGLGVCHCFEDGRVSAAHPAI